MEGTRMGRLFSPGKLHPDQHCAQPSSLACKPLSSMSQSKGIYLAVGTASVFTAFAFILLDSA